MASETSSSHGTYGDFAGVLSWLCHRIPDAGDRQLANSEHRRARLPEWEKRTAQLRRMSPSRAANRIINRPYRKQTLPTSGTGHDFH